VEQAAPRQNFWENPPIEPQYLFFTFIFVVKFLEIGTVSPPAGNSKDSFAAAPQVQIIY